jgi:hypothetical protein
VHKQYGLNKSTYDFFKIKKHKFEGSYNLNEGKTMVYANHRSQADFFLHNVLMNFQTNFLSR